MAKVVRCREVGVDCDFEARGETEQEVLDKCAEHGRTAHGMQELSPELVQKVRAAIREEPEGQGVGA
jgi:predicted small metal-binding protein